MLFDLAATTSSNILKPFRLLPLRRLFHQNSIVLFTLAAIGIFAELFINPYGEFPLNDDWSYTLSLRHLYDTNRLVLEGWTSMPLLTQLLWGLLFCKAFGFSFTILRISTAILGIAGAMGTCLLMQECNAGRGISLFAAVVLLLNPIYLNLSNTFMTDVPFTAFLIFSILFFVKACKDDKPRNIALGILFVVLATMVRQLGLLVAGAFSLAYFIKGGYRTRSLVIAILASAIPLAVYLFYNHWIRVQGIYPSKYDEGIKRIAQTLTGKDHSTIRLLFRQGITILVYCGCFIFPLLFFFDWKKVRENRRSAVWISAGLVLFLTGYALFYKPVMPLMGSMLNIYGLGPVTLKDVGILPSANLTPLPDFVWRILSIAGVLGAGAIVLIPRKLGAGSPARTFLIVFAMLYTATMLVGGTYDRYLLPLLPVLFVLIATAFPLSQRPTLSLALASFMLIAFGLFSVAGTADYISWNRARWHGIRYLLQDARVSPRQIDAGFEFNGYYGYNESDVTAIKQQANPNRPSWWWVRDDQYMVSFGPVKGYAAIRTYPFRRFLGPSSAAGDNIYVLKKSE